MTRPAPPADAAEAEALLQAALAALDRIGNPTARHAAAVLVGARAAGRKSVDDAAALAEVAEIAATGRARAAVGIVAARMARTPEAIAATARRLRRKMKRSK